MYTHRLGPRDHILRTTLPKPDDSSQALPLASRLTAILACCPDLHATRPLIHPACSIIASVTTGFRLSFYDALYVDEVPGFFFFHDRVSCGPDSGSLFYHDHIVTCVIAWSFNIVAQFRVVTALPRARPTDWARRLSRMPPEHHT